jgi:hypothetical protein
MRKIKSQIFVTRRPVGPYYRPTWPAETNAHAIHIALYNASRSLVYSTCPNYGNPGCKCVTPRRILGVR